MTSTLVHIQSQVTSLVPYPSPGWLHLNQCHFERHSSNVFCLASDNFGVHVKDWVRLVVRRGQLNSGDFKSGKTDKLPTHINFSFQCPNEISRTTSVARSRSKWHSTWPDSSSSDSSLSNEFLGPSIHRSCGLASGRDFT